MWINFDLINQDEWVWYIIWYYVVCVDKEKLILIPRMVQSRLLYLNLTAEILSKNVPHFWRVLMNIQHLKVT